MMMKKVMLGIVAVCALCNHAAHAQALPSLLVPSNPESAAIAVTSVAREAGAFAVDNNAAAISLSEKRFAIGASWNFWAPEQAANQIAGFGTFGRIGKRIGIGLSGRYVIERPMDISSQAGGILGSFTPSEISGNLAVSVKLVDGLSVAVTGKIINSSIGQGLSGTAIGTDISVAWRRKAISAGAAVCNLGSRISYGENSYSLPTIAKAGAAYTAFGFTASIEADYLFSRALVAGIGLEYNLFDTGFLRAGYHYGQEDKGLPSFASTGIGIRFAGLEIAATWLTASETIGNSLMFGVGYSF